MKAAIEYTGFETKHIDKKFRGQLDYTDPEGRRLTIEDEVMTVREEGCTDWVSASVSLPDPGTEAAQLLVRAVLAAMEMDEDYELVKKQPA
ncbi:hypothetical protein [Nocardiopsis synnemataformans]|uniref:hypothetical protein n=1 Tax=Nocardiopsis synnemataformans TaxID=61305 RepID=UPI003EB9D2B0